MNTQKLREQGYPESLIALVERNPETKDFVLDYPKYKGLEEIDISKDVMKGEIPHFCSGMSAGDTKLMVAIFWQ